MIEKDIYKHFQVFTEFSCEETIHSLEDVMTASMLCLEHVPSSRQVVLQFYDQLFEEYCYEYCVANATSNNSPSMRDKTSSLFTRFVQAMNKMELYQRQDSFKRSESTASNNQDCPSSPPRESNDFDIDDVTFDLKENGRLASTFEMHLGKLGDKLRWLMEQSDDHFFTTFISDWALNLACNISQKLSRFVTSDSTSFENSQSFDNLALINSLRFWIQCPVMKFLTVFIFCSFDKSKANRIISNFSFNSYWILAHLFSNPTKGSYLTEFIEELINNSNDEAEPNNNSRIVILSYVSKHNPHAIINCSKSNIPFLLKLCTNSKPLLDLLAYDIAKKVDIKVLNKFTGMYQSEYIDAAILYCLLNAPNAFELLLISFDLISEPASSQALKKRIFKLHRLIVSKMQSLVYSQANVETIMDESYMILLKSNIKKLITHPSIRDNLDSKKIQFRLINLTCAYFGLGFTTSVFHHLLNNSLINIDIGNYENPRIHYLLSPLYNSLKLYFGYKIQHSLRDTLKLFIVSKAINFWASLYAWVITRNEENELEFADLIEYLNQKTYIDSSKTMYAKYYILKICMKLFDNPKHYHREQFKLCAALLELYFDLIDRIDRSDRAHLPLYMNTLVECQTFLAQLAKSSRLNEQIIVKNLLDLIQAQSVLFMERHTNTKINTINYCTSLLNENSLRSDKIKKSKLLPFYKEQKESVTVENKLVALNRQLVIDLFLKCINDRITFAKTFVSSLSNEVLLNDVTWLEEDMNRDGYSQHVRITLEQDLLISRLFETNPILWSLLNVFSRENSLQYCLVVVKALVNVQRASLTSTNNTNSHKNIESARRLIALLSNDEILPRKPFLYINELLPKCSEWEVAYLLQDMARYIRDSNQMTTTSIISLKQYLDRIRIILASKHPGETYAQIFRSI